VPRHQILQGHKLLLKWKLETGDNQREGETPKREGKKKKNGCFCFFFFFTNLVGDRRGDNTDSQMERKGVHCPSLRQRFSSRVEAQYLRTHQRFAEETKASLPQNRQQTRR